MIYWYYMCGFGNINININTFIFIFNFKINIYYKISPLYKYFFFRNKKLGGSGKSEK